MRITKYLILLLGLGRIAWFDMQKKLIPNQSVFMLLELRGVLLLLEYWFCKNSGKEEMILAVTGLVSVGILFLWFYFLSGKAIGAGDIKLLMVIGSYIGSDKTFCAAFFATVYALFQSGFRKRKCKQNLEEKIAFAPYIFCGTVTVFFLEI